MKSHDEIVSSEAAMGCTARQTQSNVTALTAFAWSKAVLPLHPQGHVAVQVRFQGSLVIANAEPMTDATTYTLVAGPFFDMSDPTKRLPIQSVIASKVVASIDTQDRFQMSFIKSHEDNSPVIHGHDYCQVYPAEFYSLRIDSLRSVSRADVALITGLSDLKRVVRHQP